MTEIGDQQPKPCADRDDLLAAEISQPGGRLRRRPGTGRPRRRRWRQSAKRCGGRWSSEVSSVGVNAPFDEEKLPAAGRAGCDRRHGTAMTGFGEFQTAVGQAVDARILA
jgi:hypothetical protein